VKCIKCQTDSKYSERSDGACPKCRQRFAFEPKTGDVFTDPAFAAAIDRVSAHDAVRFTQTNLYYELARTKRSASSKRALFIVLAIVTALFAGFLAMVSESVIIFVVALLLPITFIALAITAKPSETPALTQAAFASLLDRWKRAHGAPAKLVHRIAPASRSEPRRALPRELATYSFDRAVICDGPETVDLLLANNFHFENNCAILSVTRYPEAVFEPVLEMLRRNPRIEVYALHDASPEGHVLARTLAMSPQWFRGIGRVTDVGLLVRHAAKMRGLWTPSFRPTPVAFPDLTAEENAWLSSYSLELAAIRPEQIIKRLFRAMTQPGVQVTTDDGGFYFVGGSFGGSDAGTSDGGGDSFG
jgi:hypothetical protein